ncbi:hypothetical protein [Rodentibacter caecimuris]|uniref:hypothetical protein n=1 Tax=Rodentibacter caecimuris TaxID=1796644 RepID=UPI00211A5C2B|nr:hypothetical protein [Rodentibacter heylii]MCQ9122612.1 hypothetical protein [Rodentibacter heylii]
MDWVDLFGLSGCHGHHSDPKFLGGDPKQALTKLEASIHRALHKVIGNKTVHMRPQRGNSGIAIRRNFSRSERLDALTDFYKTTGSKYTEAASDFFKQHPNLR